MAQVSTPHDPASLDRFLAAQDQAYDAAFAELGRGRKRSHWMWFIFPQLRGLGQSTTAHFYGIVDLDEADRYQRHPVLGPRLLSCTNAVLAHSGVSAKVIFGQIDATKLRSSATLFAIASTGHDPFVHLVERFFDSNPCAATLQRLEAYWPPNAARSSSDGAK